MPEVLWLGRFRRVFRDSSDLRDLYFQSEHVIDLSTEVHAAINDNFRGEILVHVKIVDHESLPLFSSYGDISFVFPLSFLFWLKCKWLFKRKMRK